jgi:hypothetical protein
VSLWQALPGQALLPPGTPFTASRPPLRPPPATLPQAYFNGAKVDELVGADPNKLRAMITK